MAKKVPFKMMLAFVLLFVIGFWASNAWYYSLAQHNSDDSSTNACCKGACSKTNVSLSPFRVWGLLQ